MKRISFLLILFLSTTFYAQTNLEKFGEISDRYKNHLKYYSEKYKKQQKEKFFVEKIDSLSKEYQKEQLALLQNIKASEEREYVIPESEVNLCGKNVKDRKGVTDPNFDKYLRKRKSSLEDYFKPGETYPNELETLVTFMVEKNGSVSFVRASGSNEKFNQDAEITMYKSGFYMPHCINGKPERVRFRVPLVLKIE